MRRGYRLSREYGRAPRGERLYQEVSGKRRERTRIIAALPKRQTDGPLVFQGSCNTDVVEAYFEQCCCPSCRKAA